MKIIQRIAGAVLVIGLLVGGIVLVRTSGDTVFNSARRFGIYDDTLYCVYSFKPTNRT